MFLARRAFTLYRLEIHSPFPIHFYMLYRGAAFVLCQQKETPLSRMNHRCTINLI